MRGKWPQQFFWLVEVLLVGECMAFVASGSDHTMTVSARAILADLKLAPWNHKEWKEVQPRSGIKECSR